jgi:hypothetical protein
MSSAIELSAAVFGQHVHPMLILVKLFFCGRFKGKGQWANPRTEDEPKQNIRMEIANIPAEQFQRINQHPL